MEILFGILLLSSFACIGYAIWLNKKAKEKLLKEEEARLAQEEDILEQSRIQKERAQKLQKERTLAEENRKYQQLRSELGPLLRGFYIDGNLYTINKYKEKLIELLSNKEQLNKLLNFHTDRQLPEGKTYKVGFLLKLHNYEMKLTPVEVEELQNYFVNLSDFHTLVKEKGIQLSITQIQEMMIEEISHRIS